ncbi:MAG: hypothetical protein COC24_019290 [Alphaproteobacteria bacterium]|nr:hypothetical protein [Alphaproteobacteria bacterium]
MSQIPTDLFHKITVKVPRGHQGYWNIIKVLGANEQSFILSDVYLLTNGHTKSVSDYVKRLVKAKYLKVVSRIKTHNIITIYHYKIMKMVINAPRLRRDGSECLPTKNQYMWQTMRALNVFDAHELADRATTEVERPIALGTANRYLQALCKAGYLAIYKAHKNTSLTRYRFLKAMDTGELAPRIMRSKVVWDANLCQMMCEPEYEEVAA